ncbi:MAG TPA: amidohydrolase family protein [Candidatus Bathyarchaeia archaeon]|nr:amidohydrolase family protein [Candidatus Bathyarchaeia archaeon]
MRGIICQEATERISKENGELGIKENLEFVKKWNNDPEALVKGMFCVHTVFSCSPEMLKKVRELANEYKAGIHLHVEESVYEVNYCRKTHGKASVFHLDDLGVLGSDVVAAQCVQTTEAEIEILAERGVKVAHNLQTNMEIGAGIAQVPKMLQEGVTVGIGNDGFVPDMFEVLRGVYLTHKGVTRDISVLPAEKCLEMATIDGARVLGMDREIGSIEKGKKADMIIVDLPNVTPLTPENIYSQIISTAMGRGVESSIIDGRVVMEKRRVLTTDPEKAMKKCEETSLDIWNRNKVNLEKRLL